MSGSDVTPREALLRLGASTAEAVARVLEMFLPDGINRGDVTILPDAGAAFAELPFGAIAASVSYVDGVSGANVFVMDPAGARAMTSAMGVPSPEEETPAEPRQPIELTELELSAVAEAANQMMSAAAAAISVVLGQEIGISPPDTRVVDDPKEAIDRFGTAPHATSTTFTIAGKTCRLIQLVPSAFVVRMARAIDEQSDQPAGDDTGGARTSDAMRSGARDGVVALSDALCDIHLRVWTELGRTSMPLGEALQLPFGAVVDLDRPADAPVDLFVNGLRFAQGHLLVTDDGEWAVRLETVGGQLSNQRASSAAQSPSKGAGT